MNETPPMPLDDRSPSDGELFSLEYLYTLQSDAFRRRHGLEMIRLMQREQRIMRYVDQELPERAGVPHEPFPTGDSYDLWSFQVRGTEDDELREERAIAEDRIIRAMGQFGLAFSTFDALYFRLPTVPPPSGW